MNYSVQSQGWLLSASLLQPMHPGSTKKPSGPIKRAGSCSRYFSRRVRANGGLFFFPFASVSFLAWHLPCCSVHLRTVCCRHDSLIYHLLSLRVSTICNNTFYLSISIGCPHNYFFYSSQDKMGTVLTGPAQPLLPRSQTLYDPPTRRCPNI